ncbi:hypothetical protein [Enterococcus gallinarum]|uniref:hypothetical protein n=1 Tax=Enterococcus gallinarum TaxID=1353 RepID=UPI002433D9DD|nr:hypothetical protein [Enterococcus gallinarum]
MISHGKVQSTVKPQAIEIDDNSVWITENVQEVKTEGFEGYEYDLTQYTKDEYIQILDERDKMKSDAILELSEIVANLAGGAE